MKQIKRVRIGGKVRFPDQIQMPGTSFTVFVKVKHDDPGIAHGLAGDGYCCLVRLNKDGNPVGTLEVMEETLCEELPK